jgi:uncharacterized membrane protein
VGRGGAGAGAGEWKRRIERDFGKEALSSPCGQVILANAHSTGASQMDQPDLIRHLVKSVTSNPMLVLSAGIGSITLVVMLKILLTAIPERLRQNLPQLRFYLLACFFGLLAVYAWVFPLKACGLVPEQVTWLVLTLAPAAIFGACCCVFAGMFWCRNRWRLLSLPLLLCLTLLIFVSLTLLIFMQDLVEKQKVSWALAGVKKIEEAMEVYRSRFGQYPANFDVLCHDRSPPLLGRNMTVDPWGQSYIIEPGQWIRVPHIFSWGPPGSGKIVGNWPGEDGIVRH